MTNGTKDLKKSGAGLKNPKHTLLDLFSGIGGFAKGLMDAGFEIEKHYFSEIDKHAIANYKNNFPHAEYIGAIQDVSGRNIKPTIITFGSPCQDFSLAGKRKGMDGKRSSLITNAIGLVRELKPHFFIWENVKGTFSSNNGEDFWAIIRAFADIGGYRCEWQLLNTSWFLPQNRERIYLVGHLAGRSEPRVFPIEESNKWSNERDSETTTIRTITAGGHSGGHHSGMTLIRHRSTEPFEEGNIAPTLRNSDKGEIRVIGNLKGEGGHNVNNIHSVDGIAPTVRENHGKITPIMVKSNTQKGYEEAEAGDSINFSVPSSKTRRGRVGKKKAQTIDTACNQAVIVPKIITNIYESGGQNGNVFDPNGISPTLSSGETSTKGNGGIGSNNAPKIMQTNMGEEMFINDYSGTLRSGASANYMTVNNIRRLTEIECERLQGFPDDWTKFGNYDGTVKPIAKTQRYKMLGNAVSKPVVEAVAKRLL